jgi:leucyl aminopeptidase (aminopeptidase T)
MNSQEELTAPYHDEPGATGGNSDKRGRVQIETVTSDVPEEAEKFKTILRLDENASNCAAELGLGTSHTASRILRGDVMGDYGTAGHVHLAVGRNDDIGGKTYSKVHNDVLMTRATVALDGVCPIEKGEIVIKQNCRSYCFPIR